MKTLLPMLAMAALAVGGCTSKTDNSTTVAAENVTDLTPQGPSLTAKLFGGGKALTLDQQKILANGVVVTLTSFQAKADEAVLGVRINNGFERDIELDWADKKTFLVAAGQKFYLSPPVENKDVRVIAGSKMEGELVFLGAVPKGANVTLVVNDGMSDGQYSSNPGFSLPLQVTEAAWSDDGSKKKSAV